MILQPAKHGIGSKQFVQLLTWAPWVIAGSIVVALMVGTYWVGRYAR